MISMKSEPQFTQAEIRLLRAVIASAEQKGILSQMGTSAPVLRSDRPAGPIHASSHFPQFRGKLT